MIAPQFRSNRQHAAVLTLLAIVFVLICWLMSGVAAAAIVDLVHHRVSKAAMVYRQIPVGGPAAMEAADNGLPILVCVGQSPAELAVRTEQAHINDWTIAHSAEPFEWRGVWYGVGVWIQSSTSAWNAQAVMSTVVGVPPGSHAHQRSDGLVIVHEDSNDSNFCNPAAHVGIEWPWWELALGPGRTVRMCPPGGCSR